MNQNNQLLSSVPKLAVFKNMCKFSLEKQSITPGQQKFKMKTYFKDEIQKNGHVRINEQPNVSGLPRGFY